MGLQSGRSPNFENFETLDLGVLGKMTFGCNPVVNHKEYYKGEGANFPQVWVMVSLESSCMPRDSFVHQKCSHYALTNLLFGLCRSI
jgi:hypothetical protein